MTIDTREETRVAATLLFLSRFIEKEYTAAMTSGSLCVTMSIAEMMAIISLASQAGIGAEEGTRSAAAQGAE